MEQMIEVKNLSELPAVAMRGAVVKSLEDVRQFAGANQVWYYHNPRGFYLAMVLANPAPLVVERPQYVSGWIDA